MLYPIYLWVSISYRGMQAPLTIYAGISSFSVASYTPYADLIKSNTNKGFRLASAFLMLYIVSAMEVCAESVKRLLSTFLKYLVAGGLGFVVDYSTLFILYTCLGVHYLLSAGGAFVAGLLFVYVSSNKWVFSNRQMQDKQWLEFCVFALIGLVGLGLTVLLMWMFVDLCGIHPLISKFVTTGFVLLWNFTARKVILY